MNADPDAISAVVPAIRSVCALKESKITLNTITTQQIYMTAMQNRPACQ